jgi:hypothetical protein
MKQIFGLLRTIGIKVVFTLLCIFLISISCKKEQSKAVSTIPPPPPPPPPTETVTTVIDSIFTNQIPAGKTGNDSMGGIELGLKFRSTAAGNIVGVKFYKTPGNSGRHTGELYSSDGALLASQAFTNETDSGWQTVIFVTPVPIVANTTYIAAYHSSLGNYVATALGLKTEISNAPLTALADSTDGINGLYKYTAIPALPDSGYMSSNYWVDVLEKINNK